MLTWLWRKTRCESNACVRVRRNGEFVEVMDEMGAIVRYTFAEWNAFVADVKTGYFDLEA